MKTVTLFYHNSSLKTLKEYMDAERIFGIKVEDLFEQNKLDIFKQMSPDDKAKYAKKINKDKITAEDLKYDMELPCPCILNIGCQYVTRDLTISQTNFEENTDDLYAFENDNIQNIFQNSGYRIDSSTRKFKPNCIVYGWFKSLYYVGRDRVNGDIIKTDENNKNFVNISNFVISLSTDVTESGGSFNMTLPIINSEAETKINFLNKNFGSWNERRARKIDVHSYDKEFFHKIGVNSFHSNFFNWLIQSNDLLFISFEDLEMEKSSGIKNFDMIALVENVSESIDANGAGTISVSGRDLMKLITDDNSLFFNTSTVWGNSQIFANTESEGKQGDVRDVGNRDFEKNAIQRIRRSTNEIDVFAEPFNRTISFIIKGVISQLANIEVVPDDTFTSWGDRRTKFNDFYPENGGKGGGGRLSNGNSSNGNEEIDASNPEFRTGIEFNASKGEDENIMVENLEKSVSPSSLSASDLELGRKLIFN